MMWGDGYGMGWGWGLGMIVFWVLLIVVIVVLVRGFAGPRADPPRRDALDTLRERYAAGEINDEEFERRKKALER